MFHPNIGHCKNRNGKEQREQDAIKSRHGGKPKRLGSTGIMHKQRKERLIEKDSAVGYQRIESEANPLVLEK